MSELIFNPANHNPMNLINLNPPPAASFSGKDRAELKKVAEEFEAVFIGQLLKVMRQTIEESGLEGGGFGKSIYTELFDQEIALNMARRGALGIGDIIYRNLADEDPESIGGMQPGLRSFRSAPESLNMPPASGGVTPALGIPGMVIPVKAPISSGFGMRKDPFTGAQQFHRGIDLAAPTGTPVVAALPGRVISVSNDHSGYGKTVLVEHDGGLRTRYGHLDSINVKVGDMVTSDNMIGRVGSTGRSTGPHLHFEVIRAGSPLDPTKAVSLK